MTLLIIPGSVVAYFAVGLVFAVRALPYAWAHALKVYGDSTVYARENVAIWSTFRVLFWPVLLPALVMGMAINRHDPVRIKAEMEARDKRIKDLERELGYLPTQENDHA